MIEVWVPVVLSECQKTPHYPSNSIVLPLTHAFLLQNWIQLALLFCFSHMCWKWNPFPSITILPDLLIFSRPSSHQRTDRLTGVWCVYADVAKYIGERHLMWGHLKEVWVKMCTTAGVWTYRLFIWLSGTLSVTPRRIVGSARLFTDVWKQKRKKASEGDQSEEKSRARSQNSYLYIGLQANAVYSLSLSNMGADKPCGRDMWCSHSRHRHSHTHKHIHVLLKRSTFSASALIHQPFGLLQHSLSL